MSAMEEEVPTLSFSSSCTATISSSSCSSSSFSTSTSTSSVSASSQSQSVPSSMLVLASLSADCTADANPLWTERAEKRQWRESKWNRQRTQRTVNTTLTPASMATASSATATVSGGTTAARIAARIARFSQPLPTTSSHLQLSLNDCTENGRNAETSSASQSLSVNGGATETPAASNSTRRRLKRTFSSETSNDFPQFGAKRANISIPDISVSGSSAATELLSGISSGVQKMTFQQTAPLSFSSNLSALSSALLPPFPSASSTPLPTASSSSLASSHSSLLLSSSAGISSPSLAHFMSSQPRKRKLQRSGLHRDPPSSTASLLANPQPAGDVTPLTVASPSLALPFFSVSASATASLSSYSASADCDADFKRLKSCQSFGATSSSSSAIDASPNENEMRLSHISTLSS